MTPTACGPGMSKANEDNRPAGVAFSCDPFAAISPGQQLLSEIVCPATAGEATAINEEMIAIITADLRDMDPLLDVRRLLALIILFVPANLLFPPSLRLDIK